MKNRLMLLLLFLSLFRIGAYAQTLLLVIEMKDKSTVSFALNEKPEISFSTSSMFVDSETMSAEYKLNSVLRYYFVEGTPSGVDSIEMSENEVRFTYQSGDNLLIEGVDDSSSLYIYDISGRRHNADVECNGGSITVSMHQLQPGIYIVNVMGKYSVKINKNR